MDINDRPLLVETGSTDGSEDSWIFLDDVEPCAEVETILLADAVKPISLNLDDDNVSEPETEPEPEPYADLERVESIDSKR